MFTTRTEDVAKALTDVAGKRHGIVELRIPDVEDAAKLFLKHLNGLETAADANKIQEVVKGIGCLPLAVAQAALYMTGTGRSLDDMLSLFKSERKFDVSLDSTDLRTKCACVCEKLAFIKALIGGNLVQQCVSRSLTYRETSSACSHAGNTVYYV